jgi:hypothetical protein
MKFEPSGPLDRLTSQWAAGPEERLEAVMSLFSKLFSGKKEPRQRVRICVECGMPVAEHKSWCSIFRTLQEQQAAARPAAE